MKGKISLFKRRLAAFVALTMAILPLMSALPAGMLEVQADAVDDNVIFICDGATGDGSSAASPLAPTTGNYNASAALPEYQKDTALYQAIQQLITLGGGTIVFCGPYTLDNTNTQRAGATSVYYDFQMNPGSPNRTVTIRYTSVYGGVDYRTANGAKLILDGGTSVTFPTNTVTENLTVQAANANAHYIAADFCSLTLGQGTNFVPSGSNYPVVLGGLRTYNGIAAIAGNSNITVDIGAGNTIGAIYGLCMGGNKSQVGNVNITVNSGTVGAITGDTVSANQVPVSGNVNITLNGGTFTGAIAGVNNGFTGGGKELNITVTGGDFTSCPSIKAATTSVPAANLPVSATVDATTVTKALAQRLGSICDSSLDLQVPEFPNVIFIADGATGDGSSPTSPLAPTTGNYNASAALPEYQKDTALYQAISQLIALGGGTIVLVGPYTLNNSNTVRAAATSSYYDFQLNPGSPNRNVTITYTSVWEGVDYRTSNGAKLILDGGTSITFPTNTVTENLTVQAANGNAHYIAADFCSLTLGQGTNFVPSGANYPVVLGGLRTYNGIAAIAGDANITVNLGAGNTIGKIYGLCMGGNKSQNGNVNITVNSGTVGEIYGDTVSANQVPVNGNVNITLNGGTFTGAIYGVNNGFTGGGKQLNISVTGGDFTACPSIKAATTSVPSDRMPVSATVNATTVTKPLAQRLGAICDSSVTLNLPEFPNVIFIADGATGDGTDPASPLAPSTGNYDATAALPQYQKDTALYQAIEELISLGGGTIVFVGPYTLNNSNTQRAGATSSFYDFQFDPAHPNKTVTITYTSVWEGVDYRTLNGAKLILDGGTSITFPTNTVTTDLTIQAANANQHYIAADFCNLTLGNGTNFVMSGGYPVVLGGLRTYNGIAAIAGDSNITVDLGAGNSIGKIYGLCIPAPRT